MEIVYNRRNEFESLKKFDALSDHLVPEEERSYNNKKYKNYEELPLQNNSDLKIVGGKNFEENLTRKIRESSKSF